LINLEYFLLGGALRAPPNKKYPVLFNLRSLGICK
jgi:hypothetical protein